MTKSIALWRLFSLTCYVMVLPYILVVLMTLCGKFGYAEHLFMFWGYFHLSYLPILVAQIVSIRTVKDCAVEPFKFSIARVFVVVHFVLMLMTLLAPVPMTGLDMMRLSLLWLIPSEICIIFLTVVIARSASAQQEVA